MIECEWASTGTKASPSTSDIHICLVRLRLTTLLLQVLMISQISTVSCRHHAHKSVVSCLCAHELAQHRWSSLGHPTCLPSCLALGLPSPSRLDCPWSPHCGSACNLATRSPTATSVAPCSGPRLWRVPSLTWLPCLLWCCGDSTCVSAG